MTPCASASRRPWSDKESAIAKSPLHACSEASKQVI